MSTKVYSFMVEEEEGKIFLLKAGNGEDQIFYYEEIGDMTVDGLIEKFNEDLKIAKDVEVE